VTALLERLAAGLQHLLPQKTLSAIVYRLMRCEARWLKNLLIRFIGGLAGVNWSEAESPDPGDYVSFNAFFTRALRAGARPVDPDPHALLCPCDGRISETGRLDGSRLLQAKGNSYSLESLLAGDSACTALHDGWFATIYLSPRDYHRVHMPLAGTLQRMIHVPGRLFSVAPYTVRHIPGLFARNERVISVFDAPNGPFAQVLVGAIMVSSMETVWAGEVTPSGRSTPGITDYGPREVVLARGAEMGRFNMGSTVILVLPPGAVKEESGLRPGDPVRVGQRLATLS
jgi:phosphatidylserine decarboxylase